ncbi:hypothetical protein CR513_51459, partial [Mucuna pruriens]
MNLTILDVVKKEVTKLLVIGIIYPISDSQWVSPVQLVPKMSGMTVMKNEHDEQLARIIFLCLSLIKSWKNYFHQRHPGYTRKDFKVMPNTTYGMILTYGNFAMIKLFTSVFLMPRSHRSSSFVMQHLEAAIMDQLKQPEKYSTASSIGPPFSGTHINSSPPAKNAKNLEWP